MTRLLPDGRPDPAFGVAGSADVHFGRRYDYGEAVALAANGDILLAGSRVNYSVNRGESDSSLAVARLKPNGSLDRSFGKDGVSILPGGGEIGVFDIAPTPTSSIVLDGGNEIETFLWKLNRNGSVDRHFGRGGLVDLRYRRERHGRHEELFDATQLAVSSGGKLSLAATGFPSRGHNGRFRVVTVRLRPDGRVDRSYGDDGWAAVGTDHGSTFAGGLTLLPGGVLMIATSFERPGSNENRDFGAVAFGPNGHLEHRFGNRGKCLAHLPGREEALGVASLDGGGAVVGFGYGDPHPWLLDCSLRSG